MHDKFKSLALRVQQLKGMSHHLDLEAELAMFKPDNSYRAIRSNNAKTKVIYTDVHGMDHTYWPFDHTLNAEARAFTVKNLLARSKEEGKA